MLDSIRISLSKSAACLQAMAESAEVVNTLNAVASTCVLALSQGRKILLVGNGGSAADCQHIAAELVARFKFDRPGLPAIALTVDSSALTAIGNDYGFQQVFARQVHALGQAGDVLWAYSTSGASPNILSAIDAAKARGMLVVGLTGARPSPMEDGRCDHLLRTPSADTPLIQEGHLVMGHLLCGLIESTLFKSATC